MSINSRWLRDRITETSNHALIEVFELFIELEGTLKPIWRKVWIPCDMTLNDLHTVIQAVMPWEDRHAEEFCIDKVKYLNAESAFENNDNFKDSRDAKLSSIITKGIYFRYVYDFGDVWKHQVSVTDCLTVKLRNQIPVCIAGENACPPEDVGGVEGFEQFLQAISNPHTREGKLCRAWSLGFEDRQFSPHQANALIAYRFAAHLQEESE